MTFTSNALACAMVRESIVDRRQLASVPLREIQAKYSSPIFNGGIPGVVLCLGSVNLTI